MSDASRKRFFGQLPNYADGKRISTAITIGIERLKSKRILRVFPQNKREKKKSFYGNEIRQIPSALHKILEESRKAGKQMKLTYVRDLLSKIACFAIFIDRPAPRALHAPRHQRNISVRQMPRCNLCEQMNSRS